MKCPNCGSDGIWRDEVDVGVGVIYGPYGCPDCGWSESSDYNFNLEDFEPETENGYVKDQWGGLTPPKEK